MLFHVVITIDNYQLSFLSNSNTLLDHFILDRVGQLTSLEPIQLVQKMWTSAKKTSTRARRIQSLSVKIQKDRLLAETVLQVNDYYK